MTIPNFRRMTEDELMSFWATYHRPSRKLAETLVGDRRKGFTTIASRLANYACNLAVQRKCAAQGDTDGAAIYGHSVKLCLESLPPDVRSKVERQR